MSASASAEKPRAAIFILTQNTEIRRAYLKTALYFLFKHFNAEFKYPVLIFHEGDYTPAAQREIIVGVRESCRHLVSFVALDPTDFKIPDHIDHIRMLNCIATRPVPYWRNAAYRLMCRWWIVCMPKYAAAYDYVMRIDDDSIIEEPIRQDLFAWFHEKGLNYAGNIIHQDCGICCYGMRDFFLEHAGATAEQRAKIEATFTRQEVPMRAVQFHPLRALLSINAAGDGRPPPQIPEKLPIWSPTMFFNNYHITRSSFWARPEVKAVCEAFDRSGGWAYYRWGDSPVQSIIATLFSKPEEISKTRFAYSKRLQREAFLGETVSGEQEAYSYMPGVYSDSSCMSERPGAKS